MLIPRRHPRNLARGRGDENLVGREAFGFADGALDERNVQLFAEVHQHQAGDAGEDVGQAIVEVTFRQFVTLGAISVCEGRRGIDQAKVLASYARLAEVRRAVAGA